MASARRSLFQPHRVTMGCEHRITYDGMGVRGIFFCPFSTGPELRTTQHGGGDNASLGFDLVYLFDG